MYDDDKSIDLLYSKSYSKDFVQKIEDMLEVTADIQFVSEYLEVNKEFVKHTAIELSRKAKDNTGLVVLCALVLTIANHTHNKPIDVIEKMGTEILKNIYDNWDTLISEALVITASCIEKELDLEVKATGYQLSLPLFQEARFYTWAIQRRQEDDYIKALLEVCSGYTKYSDSI